MSDRGLSGSGAAGRVAVTGNGSPPGMVSVGLLVAIAAVASAPVEAPVAELFAETAAAAAALFRLPLRSGR